MIDQILALQKQVEILGVSEKAIEGFVIIQDQKVAGTNGGSFNNGSPQTRDLNTTALNTLGSDYSLSSNQFVLPAGTYIILAESSCFNVGSNRLTLENITDTITEITGQSCRSGTGDDSETLAFLLDVFTITASTTFELQHECQATKGTNGFGIQVNSVFTVAYELYSIVYIWKTG